MCVFAKHNLCQDPPFSSLDLISCRNVLIYLGSFLQKRVIPIFHYALNPGGFLTLGTAETIGGFSELFASEDQKHKIYSKKSGVKPSASLFSQEFRSEEMKNISHREQPMDESIWKEVDVYKEADRVLLNQYVPCGVLVNEQMDILQFRGDTSHFLVPAPGKANLHLLNMAREGLLAVLEEVIDQAKKTDAPSCQENILICYDGQPLSVSLKVIPLRLPPLLIPYFLVLFEESSLSPIRSAKKGPWRALCLWFASAFRNRQQSSLSAEAQSQEMKRLKQELQANKHYLQSIIENRDTANEELKSANEEILSSNEELQSTNEELETAKEELQSANEELTTVNEELQNRNIEISQANDDLNNLFSSSNLALLMVGSDLRIRRFTQAAEKMLHLLSTDAGRFVRDSKMNILIPDLEGLISSVIEAVTVREQEVQDRQGNWYTMRILPYKTSMNKIDGVVILFVDITSIKSVEKLTRSLDELRIARNYSEGIVQTVRQPLLILSANLRVIRANPAFYKTFQISPDETEGQFIYRLDSNRWDIPQLRLLLEQTLLKNTEFHDFEVENDFSQIGRKTMLLNAKRIVLDGTGTETILLSIEDITDRKREKVRMEISLKEKGILLQEIHHRVKNNLQIISSLLKLWPASITDPAAIKFFKESQDRIQSIALTHEKLFASADLSKIDINAYIQGLLEHLLRSYPESEKIEFRVQINRIFVEADTAFACGLILNELLSNIFKHAFPEGRRGRVSIELNSEPNHQLILLVQDNGVGMSSDVDIAQGGSFGLNLVTQLVDQLEGNLDLDRSQDGTTFRIRFPSQISEEGPQPLQNK